MNRIVGQSPREGLEVALASYKSIVSDLVLRAKQAEELTAALLNEKIPPELLATLVAPKILEHMNRRELERSTQLLGVVETTLLVLNDAAQSTTDEGTKSTLIEVIKGLTITANHGKPNTRPDAKPH